MSDVMVEIPVMTLTYEQVTLRKFVEDIAAFSFNKSTSYSETYYKIPLGMEYITLYIIHPDSTEEEVAVLLMKEVMDFKRLLTPTIKEYVLKHMDELLFIKDLEEEE